MDTRDERTLRKAAVCTRDDMLSAHETGEVRDAPRDQLRVFHGVRRMRHDRQTSYPLAFSQHDLILDDYRQEFRALQIDPGELMRPLGPSLPFAGISKGLLARTYRHAFLVLRQVCLCTAYLQALTGLVVLYTEQYRLRPRSTGPPPAVMLESIHKLAQELHAPLMALRRLDEPVAWRSDEDIPNALRQFDAGAFLLLSVRFKTSGTAQ